MMGTISRYRYDNYAYEETKKGDKLKQEDMPYRCLCYCQKYLEYLFYNIYFSNVSEYYFFQEN